MFPQPPSIWCSDEFADWYERNFRRTIRMVKWLLVFETITVPLVLAACGPTLVVLQNPKNGEMAQCSGDALANWNPYAATEACAKGYESAGWKRTGQY